MRQSAKVMAVAVLVLALSACELRKEGGEEPAPVETEAPVTTPTATPSATPTPTESESPVASIIREDAGGAEPVAAVEPLNITLPFGDGGNDLSERAERMLIGVMGSDAMGEGWQVTLRGHTDSSGNDSANLRASRSRAEAVAAWLVERGVDDARINVVGFGEQNPIAPNALPDGTSNEAGRALNRRVDIEIAPVEAPAAVQTPTPQNT